MFNLALGWAFLISAIASPGGKVMVLIFDPAVMRSLPPYQQVIATICANYWIPAMLIYLLLKGLRAERHIRPSLGIHALFGIANVVLTLYAGLRVLSPMVPGGGATYALAAIGGIVAIPSWISLACGSAWLAARSTHSDQTQRVDRGHATTDSWLTYGVVIAFLSLIPPAAFFAWVYSTKSAMIQNVANANFQKSARFEELCQMTRIDIHRTANDAKSVLFLQWGNLPFALLDKLDFVEVNRKPWEISKGQEAFVRHRKKNGEAAFVQGRSNWISEETSESMAQYEIEQKGITEAKDKDSGFYVEEITIRDRRTGEVLGAFSKAEVVNTGYRSTSTFCPRGFDPHSFDHQTASYVLGLMDPSSAMTFSENVAQFQKQNPSRSNMR
ncbi:MAG: hypothetical protein PHU06_10425 [Gallionella sp.]|nr:hypothetical protein [Gallionella sp.]MDD4959687.1 hypothetical protein [Gallionella sp.]